MTQQNNTAQRLDYDSAVHLYAFGETVSQPIELVNPNTIAQGFNITWKQLFKNIVVQFWNLAIAIPAAVYLKLRGEL